MVDKRLSLAAIALFLLGTIALPSPASALATESALYAQRDRSEGFWANQWRRFRGRPNRNARSGSTSNGGANHDRCLYTTEELLALVPTAAETGVPYLEPVLSGHPTWWFYVPYPGNGRLQAEFVLIDAEEQILGIQSILVPAFPGPIAVTWPQDQPPLAPGQTYRWVFSILCNPANRSSDATVNGWVQRATADEAAAFATRLETAPTPHLLLADSLYWFDLLAELHTLRAADPATYEPLWNALLCEVYTQSERLSRPLDRCPSASAPAGAKPN